MAQDDYEKARSPKDNLGAEEAVNSLSQRNFFKFVLGHDEDMRRIGAAAGVRIPAHNVTASAPEPKPPTNGDDVIAMTRRIDALLADVAMDERLGLVKTAGQQVVMHEVIVEQPLIHLLPV